MIVPLIQSFYLQNQGKALRNRGLVRGGACGLWQWACRVCEAAAGEGGETEFTLQKPCAVVRLKMGGSCHG